MYLTRLLKKTLCSPSQLRCFFTKPPDFPLLSRCDNINNLKNDEFDVVVIGGGCVGAGCALDAATRGLRTALIERSDFASGTSGKSTKLIHGGVRYLQQAFENRDLQQIKILLEALQERSQLLKMAPHLTKEIPIVVTLRKWWEVPYLWCGIKIYDILAGSRRIRNSYLLSKYETLDKVPSLNPDKLKGSILYYDGQMNDALLTLAVVLTAARYEATIANYVEVCDVIQSYQDGCDDCEIEGVCVRDRITSETFDVKAKCVINATGSMADSVRKMDDPYACDICTASCGAHIVLPGCLTPGYFGVTHPSSDGRIIFMLPYESSTLVGTTDCLCEAEFQPVASRQHIDFLLNELHTMLHPSIKLQRNDVLAAWNGIRPLAGDPSKADTKSIARNHVIDVSNSKLITIIGGKFTTFRSMAKDTIDKALQVIPDLRPRHRKCQTDKLLLEGAHNWHEALYKELMEKYGFDEKIAKHLAHSYGDKACKVAEIAVEQDEINVRLHNSFPYSPAEVRYAVREQYACSAEDVIARRLTMASLDAKATTKVIRHVVSIMAEELGWSDDDCESQCVQAAGYLLRDMGLAFFLKGDDSPLFKINIKVKSKHCKENSNDEVK